MCSKNISHLHVQVRIRSANAIGTALLFVMQENWIAYAKVVNCLSVRIRSAYAVGTTVLSDIRTELLLVTDLVGSIV